MLLSLLLTLCVGAADWANKCYDIREGLLPGDRRIDCFDCEAFGCYCFHVSDSSVTCSHSPNYVIDLCDPEDGVIDDIKAQRVPEYFKECKKQTISEKPLGEKPVENTYSVTRATASDNSTNRLVHSFSNLIEPLLPALTIFCLILVAF
jgi:hypothetical protein